MGTGSNFSAVGPRVVGVVYSTSSLAAALTLKPASAAPDLLELRVDGFSDRPGALDALVAAAPRPFLLTVRDPAESGGTGNPALADPGRRAALFARFLPAAAMVDLELRNLDDPAFAGVARSGENVPLVASFHDFHGTPSATDLRALAERARQGGAAVFKVAARVTGPADVAQLLLLLQNPPLPVAAMGMGDGLARAARLMLAAGGSVLNYGTLEEGGTAAAPGQWSVARMAELLGEIGAWGRQGVVEG